MPYVFYDDDNKYKLQQLSQYPLVQQWLALPDMDLEKQAEEQPQTFL